MKRLYRSKTDRIIAGVCGGVGEYLIVDPVVVRIVWVLLALLGGSGILAYIVGIILIPENPEQSEEQEKSRSASRDRSGSQTVWGVVLIGVGLLILLSRLQVFHFFSPHFWQISWGIIFPVFLIILGVIVLTRYNRRKSPEKTIAGTEEEETGGERKTGRASAIVRPGEDRILAGVCSGIGYYIKLDPTIVRLLWVIGTVATGGVGVILYIILAIVFPEGEVEEPSEPGEPSAGK